MSSWVEMKALHGIAVLIWLTTAYSTAIWVKEFETETYAAGKKEICMDELGCFGITDDFKNIIHRPINVLPYDRAIIDTQFFLYTRKNTNDSHILKASVQSTFEESNFNPANPTKFIVPGFMDHELHGPWMVYMKDEFLKNGDYNIVIVEWSGGNKLPYYQATSNTRVAGAEIALLIQALEKFTGYKREDCHIIGHCLGSHAAGYAGARLQTLGRITGCDPAGPYFQNMPPSVRLDPSDAGFVDVIHSDAMDIMFVGFGISQEVGHFDFYPNNGRNQPGCKKPRVIINSITEVSEIASRLKSVCNRQRSLDLFHYSINHREMTPLGFECATWRDFMDGKCAECGPDTKKCAFMGIRANENYDHRNASVQKAFYLKTGAKAPFWLYHYQIILKIHTPNVFHKEPRGTLDITLFGTKADDLFHVEAQPIEFFDGARHRYVVTTAKDLGEVQSVSFIWHSSSKNPIDLIKHPKLYVEYIAVYPMNIIEKSPRDSTGRIFCGEPENGVTPKTIAILQKEENCLKFVK